MDFFSGNRSGFIGRLDALFEDGERCFILFFKDVSRALEIHFIRFSHTFTISRFDLGCNQSFATQHGLMTRGTELPSSIPCRRKHPEHIAFQHRQRSLGGHIVIDRALLKRNGSKVGASL
jgi:hypothetical protein